jgi:hypothetical protein
MPTVDFVQRHRDSYGGNPSGLQSILARRYQGLSVAQKDIGYYSPALAKRIRDNAFAWERERAAKPIEIRQSTPDPIYFFNASTETIPAYGCIQKVGTETIDGQSIIKVDRPIDYTASVMGPFLLNGPAEVAANGLGTAQWGPIFRARKDSSKGCLFTFIGDDEESDDLIKVIACETPLLAVAGSGIGANSSGTVTAKQPASGNWTAGTITYTAWNPTGVAIASAASVLLFPVDAKWLAVELC